MRGTSIGLSASYNSTSLVSAKAVCSRPVVILERFWLGGGLV
jgi:hypothetical protein